jgi:hypothetical protein
VTRADILAELRASASYLDPAHAHIYRTMRAERWLSGVGLAADLMLEHARYQHRRRGGRRAHSATIHALLDQANRVQLTAALGWLHLAYELLPSQRQPSE